MEFRRPEGSLPSELYPSFAADSKAQEHQIIRAPLIPAHGSPVILILLYQGTLTVEFPPQTLFMPGPDKSSPPQTHAET